MAEKKSRTEILMLLPEQYLEQVFQGSSVADQDPGSGAFLTPGSGMGFFRIPDLGSQDHILKSFLTIFLVKSSIIF
jgi:hypothetical protein